MYPQFVATSYDDVPSHKTRKDLGFYIGTAQNLNCNVLELGSGTGRVLLPLARAGISILGLDNSLQMLMICRAKLTAEPLSVNAKVEGLVCEDMKQFALNKHFGLIIVPFYTFCYLTTVADQVSCLTSINRHLTQNGTVILDLPNPKPSYLVDDSREFDAGTHFVTSNGRTIKRRHIIKERDLPNQLIRGETMNCTLD